MPPNGTATRDKILDAVIALAGRGLDAVTIEAVTAASGTTNGSVYHHFGSRSGVLLAAMDRVFATAITEALPALDGRPAPVAIGGFVERYVCWVSEHRREATILYGAPLAVQTDDLSPAKQEALAPVGAWLAHRMGTGELNGMALQFVDPIAFGPVHEMCRRWLANPEHIDLEASIPLLVTAVTGILA
jgi:AcrR family transcriptional regulator